jgi:hypothetical protein
MNRSQNIFLLAAVCTCAAALGVGCNSTASTAKGWVGKPASELVAAWGQPDSTVALEDGRKVLTWLSYESPGTVVPCRQSFTVSPDGTVEEFTASNCGPKQPARSYRRPFGGYR